MQDHRDDVRAAAGRARAENQTDGHTIDDAGHNGVEEVVRVEPAAMVRNLDHRLDHRRVGRGGDGAVVDDGIIAPPALKHKREQENQRRRDNRLDTELGSQYPRADDEQGDVHADGIERDLPRPQRVEHVGQTVGAARGHQIGVDKQHIADGEQQAADGEQDVGKDLLP